MPSDRRNSRQRTSTRGFSCVKRLSAPILPCLRSTDLDHDLWVMKTTNGFWHRHIDDTRAADDTLDAKDALLGRLRRRERRRGGHRGLHSGRVVSG